MKNCLFFGIISGGTKINTVPAKCTLEVDFRFSDSEELAQVKRIAENVANTSYIEGTSCELFLQSQREAMELSDINVRLLDRVNEIFKATNLTELSASSAGGGSDAAYTTQCGIPTLDSLGVQCGNIHSKDEYALVPSLKESAKRLAAICLYI